MHVAVIKPNMTMLLMLNVPSPPPLSFLQAAVVGPIEQVPYFNSFSHDGTGKRSPAVAFCNEEGKLHALEANVPATLAWAETMAIDHKAEIMDILVGNVVVIFADDAAELEAL